MIIIICWWWYVCVRRRGLSITHYTGSRAVWLDENEDIDIRWLIFTTQQVWGRGSYTRWRCRNIIIINILPHWLNSDTFGSPRFNWLIPTLDQGTLMSTWDDCVSSFSSVDWFAYNFPNGATWLDSSASGWHFGVPLLFQFTRSVCMSMMKTI